MHLSLTALRVLTFFTKSPTGELYGYELVRAGEFSHGTLYPILIRLTEKGYLTGRWIPPDEPGKPPKRVYKLTPEGVAFTLTAREFINPPSPTQEPPCPKTPATSAKPS